MARLKLFLTCFMVLWFSGRSPAYAQTDDSQEGSANRNIADLQDCCAIFIGNQSTCYDTCLSIHMTSENLLDPVLRNCSSFSNYEMCINTLSTAPTTPTATSPSTSPPAITPATYYCCALADTETCTRECHRLILAEGNETERYLELLTYCEQSDPIHDCFTANGTQPPPVIEIITPSADLIRRRCCHTAVDENCKNDCLRYYEDVTNPAWETVETDCVHRPTEGKLASCLADVSSACKLGCKDMQFCTTFNNRPNQLFRQCVADSDDGAKQQYYEWQTTRIFDHHLTPAMRLRDISQCLPDMWKLLACVYHTEPCHPVALTTYICRDDCMKLFTECSENLGRGQVEPFCDELSSSSNDSCLPLSSFIDEHEPEPIHQPCSSNPCEKGEVCQINSGCSPDDSTCMQYRCVQGCYLGNSVHSTNSVPVPNNTIVQIQLPQDDDCTGYVQCNSVNLYQSYTVQTMRPDNQCYHQRTCSLTGPSGEVIIYQHGESFQQDCNQCYCNYGQVTCSHRNCTTPLCPGCTDEAYDPVCTPSGQTFPSRCVAVCHGWSDEQLRSGNCGHFSACSIHDCPVGTRCVENRQVCLSQSSGSCSQYNCERYSACHTDDNTDIQPACDTRTQQWASLCNLLQARRQLAFRGFCKPECVSSGPVCGMDGNVYASPCHANSYHVMIDYNGTCNSSTTGDHCANVTCPELPSKECIGVLPAGACCPVCGAVVEILLNVRQLNRTIVNLNRTHVSVQDILKELNARLSTVECVLHGHVTMDGTLVVIAVPTQSPGSPMMVEVCNAEAALVSSCINNKSPLYLSSPLLSHLLQAELFTSNVIKVRATPHPTSSATLSLHLTSHIIHILTTSLLLMLLL